MEGDSTLKTPEWTRMSSSFTKTQTPLLPATQVPLSLPFFSLCVVSPLLSLPPLLSLCPPLFCFFSHSSSLVLSLFFSDSREGKRLFFFFFLLSFSRLSSLFAAFHQEDNAGPRVYVRLFACSPSYLSVLGESLSLSSTRRTRSFPLLSVPLLFAL